MNQSKIGTRYAKAAFELAQEQNCQDHFRDDMHTLSSVLVNSPDFSESLNNTVINDSVKFKIIEALFSNKFCPLSIDFIKLIIKNDREIHIPAICRHVEKLYKTSKNIHSLKLYTARNLDNKMKNKINNSVKKALEADKIEMDETIDKNIIGGFILKTEEFMYDASLKNQLARIKNNLINN
ncbi:MAG: ATP synthase F1 subunit delta [Bacteroidota bacterium]